MSNVIDNQITLKGSLPFIGVIIFFVLIAIFMWAFMTHQSYKYTILITTGSWLVFLLICMVVNAHIHKEPDYSLSLGEEIMRFFGFGNVDDIGFPKNELKKNREQKNINTSITHPASIS
jgi:amino acid permease